MVVRRVRRAVHRGALRAFAAAPAGVRRRIVRLVSPSYTVGVVVVLRHGSDVLLLDQRHDPTDWSLPGGLLERGESPRAGLARELAEELGLRLALPEDPARTMVLPDERRVDLVFEVRVDERPAVRTDQVEVTATAWRPIDAPVENPTTAAVLAAVLRPPA